MRGWRLPLLLALVALGACRREGESALAPARPAFPGLAQELPRVDRLQLVGAGNKPLWTLERRHGAWTVADRGGWPAANDRVTPLLFALVQLRLADARTADPARYARIGVEDVASADAQGVELRFGGAGIGHRLLVGHDGTPDGSFVRVDGRAESWLTDRAVELFRDPAQMLDTQLLDRPLARIESVEVRQQAGPAFTVQHRGDHFELLGAHISSSQADALAGGLDQLKLEEVAADVPAATAERELRFVGVDGVDVTVALWRDQGKVWARLTPSLDEVRAADWAARSPSDAARQVATTRMQVEAWRARFEGRKFRLVPLQASVLMLGRSQLVGAP